MFIEKTRKTKKLRYQNMYEEVGRQRKCLYAEYETFALLTGRKYIILHLFQS